MVNAQMFVNASHFHTSLVFAGRVEPTLTQHIMGLHSLRFAQKFRTWLEMPTL